MNDEFAIPDVHADAAALRSMLNVLPKEPRVVFLGDIVNKGPSSLEAMELLREASSVGEWTLLWGNHDLLFVRAVLGSLDAQLKLFTQGGGTALFDELGHPQFGDEVARIFKAANATTSPLDSLRRESRFLSDIQEILSGSQQLSELIDWMIGCFQLYYLSAHKILYVHAGIPVTSEGEARFNLDDLNTLDRQVSSELKKRDIDTSTFEMLDVPEASPLRVIKWVNMIADPSRFCEQLGVRAIVVGHSEVSPDTMQNDRFPIVRHDFGAARCKGDRPSVLQIDENQRFITHVRIDGTWKKIERGALRPAL